MESDQFGYLVGAQGSLFALNSHCQYDYISLKENFARLGDTPTYKWFPNNRLIYPQLHQYSKTAHCVRSDMNTSTPGPRGLSEHLLNPYCPTDGGDSLLGAFLRIMQRCHLVDKHWKAFC